MEKVEGQWNAQLARGIIIALPRELPKSEYEPLIRDYCREQFVSKLYSVMDDQEKRQLMESLISEIQIYEERQPNGQWLKSIKFKLPIIEEDMSLSLDNDENVETVALLSRGPEPLPG